MPLTGLILESNEHLYVYGVSILLTLGVILGLGERRKIIVFSDYDDLLITFAVPALAVVGYFGILTSASDDATSSGQGIFALLGFAALAASAALFLFVLYATLQANRFSPWRFFLAVITKFPLSVIWILQLISLINPSGDTQAQRSKNRTQSLLILTIITPIVAALVAEKSGHFSPRKVLKGKRIGKMRKHL